MEYRLRPAVAVDIEWLVELRAEVLRGDLERLDRFDEQRVPQRLGDSF
jgi:hypothetical protein